MNNGQWIIDNGGERKTNCVVTYIAANRVTARQSLALPVLNLSGEDWVVLRRLENVGGEFGEFGAFAFLQFDVGGNGLLAEFADDVVEAVGAGVNVGIVYLIGVSGKDDFCPLA